MQGWLQPFLTNLHSLVWGHSRCVFCLGKAMFPYVLRVWVLFAEVLHSWGTLVRSRIIWAVQACPSPEGDGVLGDGFYFVLFFFFFKWKRKVTKVWRPFRHRELLSYREDKKYQSLKWGLWDLSWLPDDVCIVVWACKVWAMIPRRADYRGAWCVWDFQEMLST